MRKDQGSIAVILDPAHFKGDSTKLKLQFDNGQWRTFYTNKPTMITEEMSHVVTKLKVCIPYKKARCE